jgi:tyrosine-specific transport protein
MRIFHSLGHVVGGSLLIAGTTIGVGMLALPVATGPAGFVPSVATYLACWVFMLCTGLLLVEVCLAMPNDTSFISMAQKVLGPVGRAIFWVVYLFLFATIMVAHAAGGGEILYSAARWPFSRAFAIFLYTAIFAPVVYLGARWVDRVNLFLISGVVFFYFGFVAVSLSSVQVSLLTYANWSKTWVAIPVLFTAFTYQVIIPTLMTYMERNVRKVRLAIFFGSSIPLVIYLIWEFVILGIVPHEGQFGLTEAARQGMNAVSPLKHFVASDWILVFSNWFGFFALTASFIPFALAFFDFMADGLRWEKKGIRRAVLCVLIFGLPIGIAISYPNVFLAALGYAGGISCALLFGLMPPVMAWVCRYIQHQPLAHRQLPGGKPALAGLMLISLFILGSQIFHQAQLP